MQPATQTDAACRHTAFSRPLITSEAAIHTSVSPHIEGRYVIIMSRRLARSVARTYHQDSYSPTVSRCWEPHRTAITTQPPCSPGGRRTGPLDAQASPVLQQSTHHQADSGQRRYHCLGYLCVSHRSRYHWNRRITMHAHGRSLSSAVTGPPYRPNNTARSSFGQGIDCSCCRRLGPVQPCSRHHSHG